MYACNLRNQYYGLPTHALVLAVRYIAVTNVNKIFSLDLEKLRSIGVSCNSQVTTGSTKCPGNFISLDTPLLLCRAFPNHLCT